MPARKCARAEVCMCLRVHAPMYALRFDYFCLTDKGCATSCCLCGAFILEMAAVIMLSSLHHRASLFLYHVSFCYSTSSGIIVSTFNAYPWSQMKRHLSSQTNKQINSINKNRDIAFQFLPEKCRSPLNMYFHNLATQTNTN